MCRGVLLLDSGRDTTEREREVRQVVPANRQQRIRGLAVFRPAMTIHCQCIYGSHASLARGSELQGKGATCVDPRSDGDLLVHVLRLERVAYARLWAVIGPGLVGGALRILPNRE